LSFFTHFLLRIERFSGKLIVPESYSQNTLVTLKFVIDPLSVGFQPRRKTRRKSSTHIPTNSESRLSYVFLSILEPTEKALNSVGQKWRGKKKREVSKKGKK